MIVLLACIAALLYFPALRHAVGAFVWGVLFLIAMTLLAGEVGAFVALTVGCIAFVRGFYRA
jgi:hypothetical protein